MLFYPYPKRIDYLVTRNIKSIFMGFGVLLPYPNKAKKNQIFCKKKVLKYLQQ
jgi:hypothetical protein